MAAPGDRHAPGGHEDEDLFANPLRGGVGVTYFSGCRNGGTFHGSVESKSFAHAAVLNTSGASMVPDAPDLPDIVPDHASLIREHAAAQNWSGLYSAGQQFFQSGLNRSSSQHPFPR